MPTTTFSNGYGTEACMKQKMDSVVAGLNKILLGKDNQIRLALCGLLARGHLLIEDIPGMGKTTLSHALAKIMGLSYQRIQFTNDLLPRSEEHTSELQSRPHLVCRLLLEKKKQ